MKKILNIVCVDDEKIASLTVSIHNCQETLETILIMNLLESAEEALEIIDQLRSEDPELIYVVISDWLMPGMKGDELLVEEETN
ncbi:MAG: hypothetical protein U0T81_13485 [Saprospiraceae bacterium]